MRIHYQQLDFGFVHAWCVNAGPYRHAVEYRPRRWTRRPSRMLRAKAVLRLRAWAEAAPTQPARLDMIRQRRLKLAKQAHGSIQ